MKSMFTDINYFTIIERQMSSKLKYLKSTLHVFTYLNS